MLQEPRDRARGRDHGDICDRVLAEPVKMSPFVYT